MRDPVVKCFTPRLFGLGLSIMVIEMRNEYKMSDTDLHTAIVACVSFVSIDDVEGFSMHEEGYDLLCNNLYQLWRTDWLETNGGRSVRRMNGAEKMVYLAWNDSSHPLRGIIKEYVTTGSVSRK